jgi:phosphopantothenate-cysteine ligase/phosphopantothenoylcysteine decarboxylase/phosphopantothenate--cysteine ligase
MRLLVTAGNTQAPLDAVRCITNIFSGRTGGRIAAVAHARGHQVLLLTSHPDALPGTALGTVHPYRTYDELATALQTRLQGEPWDAVIHAAAVSDYLVAGVYDAEQSRVDDHGKISSQHPELWVKLVPAPKLIDRIRGEWGFSGLLVKFKLEVGLDLAALQAKAESARVQSQADYICANTLEGMHAWALFGAGAEYQLVERSMLAETLIHQLEAMVGCRGT